MDTTFVTETSSVSPSSPSTLLLTIGAQASAQAKDERSTGLPKGIQWTFNFDAGFGAFGFANSLYANVRPDPSGDLSDNWMESFVKPAITGTFDLGKGQALSWKFSAVGERTLAAPPPLVGEEASSFKVEDMYVSWRSGKMMKIGEDALEFTIGRAQYRIGHGMILWDGAGEGGSRGGFWSNARKAWELATVGRFHAKNNLLEAFYLDRDDTPEAETGTRLLGANYERTIGKATTLGATYLQGISDDPARDGMNVYNVRAFTAPLRRLPGLAFELEYVREDKGGGNGSSTAWNAQASYELSKMKWKPRLSYRYAFFQGDDPNLTGDEGFDGLYTGFYDWGAWWQGEIAGEYFLSNNNNISHQVRLHVTPSDAVSGGLIAYSFGLDQPAAFGPAGVTSKSVASELDAYCDWKVNNNFIVSFVAAIADPKEAALEAYGRSDTFTYGMIYVAYSF